MRFRGMRHDGADACDAVGIDVNGESVDIFTRNGFIGARAYSTLSLPTARKLALAILKAVDAAEGK